MRRTGIYGIVDKYPNHGEYLSSELLTRVRSAYVSRTYRESVKSDS